MNKADQLIERDAIGHEAIKVAINSILDAVGEDSNRNILLRTTGRVSRIYAELLGINWFDTVAMVNDAVFDVKYDQMVIVRDVEV